MTITRRHAPTSATVTGKISKTGIPEALLWPTQSGERSLVPHHPYVLHGGRAHADTEFNIIGATATAIGVRVCLDESNSERVAATDMRARFTNMDSVAAHATGVHDELTQLAEPLVRETSVYVGWVFL